MARTVFLTGASGYVGRHIAREFVRRGYSVLGLARSDSAAHAIAELGASPVRGDLEAPETYRAAASSADVVVHAGFAYEEHGEERIDVDRTATAALLRFSAGADRPQSLIYTGSVFRYGPPAGEEYASELNAVPLDPTDWRHAVGEQVLTASTPSLRTAVIRLGWVFGSQGSTLAEAVCPLIGKHIPEEVASNRVPLVHVLDLARLYADVAEGEGGVFHACQGRPITVGELAKVATSVNMRRDARNKGYEEHFASIFANDTPALSIHQPLVPDLIDRIAASLRAEGEETQTA